MLVHPVALIVLGFMLIECRVIYASSFYAFLPRACILGLRQKSERDSATRTSIDLNLFLFPAHTHLSLRMPTCLLVLDLNRDRCQPFLSRQFLFRAALSLSLNITCQFAVVSDV